MEHKTVVFFLSRSIKLLSLSLSLTLAMVRAAGLWRSSHSLMFYRTSLVEANHTSIIVDAKSELHVFKKKKKKDYVGGFLKAKSVKEKQENHVGK